MSKLFTPKTYKQVELKNRIVMSPMCMYSSDDTGEVKDWHRVHYTSRAVGGVGLVMQEATAVDPQGRISANDLGIWDDSHIEGLRDLVDQVHHFGAKMAIQLAHAGRKAEVDGPIYGPSAIPFNEERRTPNEMTEADIKEVIQQFKQAAKRVKLAGYDIIEIHGAHGYLINTFLSPLSNQRTDAYGGSAEKRFTFLKEVVEAVQTEWDGPLFVRLSAEEYHPDGNHVEDSVRHASWLKALGVDLIDCSSGALVPHKILVFPGYQVPLAERIKREAAIDTGAVGLVNDASMAEEIMRNDRADLMFLGRELLRNPYWAHHAAKELGVEVAAPEPYRVAFAPRNRKK